MRPGEFKWTRERQKFLQEQFKLGKSGGEIARELGVTRSAVMGKLHRLGLKRGRAEALDVQITRKSAKKPREPRAKPVREAIFYKSNMPKLKHAYLDVELQSVINSVPKPWIERAYLECAFPIEKDGEVHSCCLPTGAGHNYCAGHRKIMFTPVRGFKNDFPKLKTGRIRA